MNDYSKNARKDTKKKYYCNVICLQILSLIWLWFYHHNIIKINTMHQKDYKFHYFNTILSSFLSKNTEIVIQKFIDS